MRRKSVMQLLLAASVAAFAPLAAVSAEPLQSAALAERLGSTGFEFRSRHNMWTFSADGRVTADDSRIPPLVQGGSSEQFGLKNTGRWRRDGDQLCIAWQDSPSEQCFTVSRGSGRMVVLAGPRIIEGTLEARDDTGYAETPPRPAPALPPGVRYQRIPGAR